MRPQDYKWWTDFDKLLSELKFVEAVELLDTELLKTDLDSIEELVILHQLQDLFFIKGLYPDDMHDDSLKPVNFFLRSIEYGFQVITDQKNWEFDYIAISSIGTIFSAALASEDRAIVTNTLERFEQLQLNWHEEGHIKEFHGIIEYPIYYYSLCTLVAGNPAKADCLFALLGHKPLILWKNSLGHLKPFGVPPTDLMVRSCWK